jgi:hypothetical protein
MKTCPNCGAQVADNEKFCGSCGAVQPEAGSSQNTQNYDTQTNMNTGYNQGNSQYNTGNYYQQPVKPTSGMAVASLVLGIVTWIFGWFTLAIPGILGLIFGIVGIQQCKHGTKGGNGMAIAGLVLSIIMVAIYFIALIYAMSIANSVINSFGYYF